MLNNNIATITVPDQDGATNISSDLGSITINRTGDNVSQTYPVSAAYAGTPVADIITNLGGNDGIVALLSTSFAGVSLSHNPADPDNSPFSIADQTITVTGLFNAVDSNPAQIGSVTINDENLPDGFYAHPNPYTFTDPAGTNAADPPLNVPNAFFIAEGTHPDVTAGNSITYNLSISLAKLPSFILDPAELDISITSTLSGSTAVDIASGNLLVNDTDLTVTITAVADITNFHGDKIALSQGSLTLTNAANASFSIASEVQKTFADPAGTAAVSSDLGAFTITATGQNLNYDIILTFAASYNLLFNDEAIADRESSSASPYTAPPCATANGSFTINEDDTSNFLAGTTITSATTDPINYYYDSTTPANNTNTISSITDSDGNTLDFSATFVIQECAARRR